MIPHIEDSEVDFMEGFYNPIAMIECLFHDVDNVAAFSEEEFSEVRLGQFPLLSYEYMLDYDPKLSEKENFKLREGAGSVYCLGGRRFGKTVFVEEMDLLLALTLLEGEWIGFTSLDALHIRGVLEKTIQALDNHPFFLLFEPKITRSPNYHFFLRNGNTLDSVNMNLQAKSPGTQFFQKHFNRLYIEEASFESEEIYKKRLDAIAENGCVVRAAGMTNFTKHSPTGRIFYDQSKKDWVCNLPQYVNPKWDDAEKAKALREHGGEGTVSYRVFVGGEVVEDGISVFDIERVRKTYNEEKHIKHFEISKESYPMFKELIVLDKPNQTVNTYICGDIGEAAPTDIIVIFEFAEKYHYRYNISLYNLTDKEQFAIFRWLMDTLGGTFLGLDTTDGTGRAIFRSLAEIYPKEHLVWVAFNEKLPVDFEKDEFGNVKYNDTLPVYKEEFVDAWSIKRLKDLLYDAKLEIPIDYKFDMQINSVIAMMSGSRTIYSCLAQEDHLLAAFRVFAIAQWYNEFSNIKSVPTKKMAKTGA